MTVSVDQERHAVSDRKPGLKRALNLPLLVLYGLGVTVGAGIYVLVGATAAKAGIYAPVSFVLAALAVAFTGLSYSEMATRYPVSAGEAIYIRDGLKIPWLAVLVGLLVALSGIVSAATVTIGSAAYLANFIPLPSEILIIALIGIITLVAIWGIAESVLIAGIFTLLELGGLLLVIYAGFEAKPDLLTNVPDLLPPMDPEIWSGIFAAGLLAFFAYIGFEDMVNVAEEVKQPGRTIPRAVILTLIVSTLVYVAVASIVILVVPLSELSQSSAPLALVFGEAKSDQYKILNLIAIIATTNGVLIQFIMVSRVLYGMANRGSLPLPWLARVNPLTRTPLIATLIVAGIVTILALFVPMSNLAETTSLVILTVFTLVNLALIRIKLEKRPAGEDVFQVAFWIPVTGFIFSGILLLSAFF